MWMLSQLSCMCWLRLHFQSKFWIDQREKSFISLQLYFLTILSGIHKFQNFFVDTAMSFFLSFFYTAFEVHELVSDRGKTNVCI